MVATCSRTTLWSNDLVDEAGLGPELVAPSAGRTSDLKLRISASRWIDLDTKTPRALQMPAGKSPRFSFPTDTGRLNDPLYERPMQKKRTSRNIGASRSLS
jgi:hypothetical protein